MAKGKTIETPPDGEAETKMEAVSAPRPLAAELVPVARLRSHPENARRHPPENIEAIRGSLARFGQQKTIVVDADGVIIAGNGTFAAAVELGWDRVAAVYSDLRGDEATAYGLADNRTNDLSDFDPEALARQLGDLAEHGVDLDALGFSGIEAVAGEDGPDADGLATLKGHATPAPPAMAWVLIGIPTVRYGEIEPAVRAIAARPGVICETGVNDGDGEDR